MTKLKGEADKLTIMAANVNTPLSTTDRTSRQKSAKIQKNSAQSTNRFESTFMEHSAQQEQGTYSFQGPMERVSR